VVRTLADYRPDVIGLSEMGSDADLQRLQEMLADEGLRLPHRELVSGADPDRHVALLSRFPIMDRQHSTRLSYQLGASRFPIQRGILDVTIEPTPRCQLRLCGVHLKSRRDTPEAEESLMRRNEAHLLRQKVDHILKENPDTQLLVFGDFNDSRDSPSLRCIRGVRSHGRYLAELPCADQRGERWTYHFPEADSYSRIDFLLASRSLLPAIAAGECRIPSDHTWRLASDHRPLTTLIRIPIRLDSTGQGKAGSRKPRGPG
jgi:endonuclease/exonuclease/phosphatase family metal-dependent hydrolase